MATVACPAVCLIQPHLQPAQRTGMSAASFASEQQAPSSTACPCSQHRRGKQQQAPGHAGARSASSVTQDFESLPLASPTQSALSSPSLLCPTEEACSWVEGVTAQGPGEEQEHAGPSMLPGAPESCSLQGSSSATAMPEATQQHDASTCDVQQRLQLQPGSRHLSSWGSCTSSSPPRRLLLLLCALLTVVGSHASGLTASGGSSSIAVPAVPRVALVSEKAFHLEVLAGFITMLEQDYGKNLLVFLHPLNFEGRDLDFGFSEFLQGFDHTRMRAAAWLGIPRFDVAIFVSPEYRVPYVREFLRQARPKVVVMMIHNGDAETLPQLMNLHPNIHFMTLSPHVQKYVAARMNITRVNWMLPLKALQPRNECPEDDLAQCLSGFAIQGAMDSRRRNYGNIFTQLDKLINTSETHRADGRLKINVVGSGKPEKLGVPLHLEGRIQPHINLRFQDFYELIHRNFALLPALASEAYYDRKFSSTLITSLVTSVPVVVDQRFLNSYTFLSDDHVIRQASSNDTTDALLRLLNANSSELAAVRRSVAALREQLSQRALGILKQLIEPVMPQVIAEYNASPW